MFKWGLWADLESLCLFLAFSLLPFLFSVSFQIPRQLSALTLYRCEQSVMDYCHAHLSLHLNLSMGPNSQELEDPRSAGYQPGRLAALPSEPVLPCPQTLSLHQWAVLTRRLCVQTTVFLLHRINGSVKWNTRLCGSGLGLVQNQRRQLIYCRTSWTRGNESETIFQWK